MTDRRRRNAGADRTRRKPKCGRRPVKMEQSLGGVPLGG
ncbi:hypothetical protein [Azospirillum argentinense]